MRGGPTKWDVGNENFTDKIFDRIRALYPCLCHIAQFHCLLERAGIPLTTDAVQLGGDPAPAAAPAAAVTAVACAASAADVNVPLPPVAAEEPMLHLVWTVGVVSAQWLNNGNSFGPLAVLLIFCAKRIQDCGPFQS